MTLLRNYIRSLLLELRDFSVAKIPSSPKYLAQIYHDGYVGYQKFDENGKVKNDPDNPLSMINYVLRWVDVVNQDPEKKKIADALLGAGIIKAKKEETKYSKSEIARSAPGLFATINDVPDFLPKYAKNIKYSTAKNSFIVDTDNKTISLDASHLGWQTRRPGTNRNGKAYVIPSGDIGFEGDQRDLQKLLKHILQQDPRVTDDFAIIESEKFRGQTVAQIIGAPRETDVALTGQGGSIVMYHGTSSKRWPKIKKAGLRPGASNETYSDLIPGYSEHNVYLTFDPSIAENYATRQAIKDRTGYAMVLKVEVPDFTKLVPDEDTMSDISLSREYRLTGAPPKRGDYGFGISDKPRTVEFDKTHLRTALTNIHNGTYVEDEELQAYKNEIQSLISTQVKKGLNAGTVAYKGIIPPKFIKPFMEYKKQAFDTPEKKGGPRQQEYDDIRKGVQKTAKRFDEKRLRQYVRQLLERS